MRNRSFNSGLLRECVHQAAFALCTQKLRSFLTLLGIVIGVAPVIALVAIMSGFNAQVVNSFARFGTGVVEFQKYTYSQGHMNDEAQKRRPDFQLQDAQVLVKTLNLAKGVSPEASHVLIGAEGVVKNERGDEANDPVIRGVWPSYQQVRNMPVEEGRFITTADLSHQSRCCVIGESVAKALFAGKEVIGHRIRLGSASLMVVGKLAKRGSGLDDSADNVVLLPLSTWADLYSYRLTDNSGALHIAIAPKDPLSQEAMIDEAVAVLRVRRGLRIKEKNDFHYWTTESEMKSLQGITQAIAGGVILVAAMALLVGGIGVMNIMLVSVTERTREIGTRNALGATKRLILMQFLMEAVALTTFGGMAGLGLGMGSALLVKLLTPLPAEAPWWSAGLGLGVSAVVGLGFGLWPALKAAGQNPIDALRYE